MLQSRTDMRVTKASPTLVEGSVLWLQPLPSTTGLVANSSSFSPSIILGLFTLPFLFLLLNILRARWSFSLLLLPPELNHCRDKVPRDLFCPLSGLWLSFLIPWAFLEHVSHRLPISISHWHLSSDSLPILLR